QHVLPAESAPPSMHLLSMLAFMPHFRNEHHEAMALLSHYLAQPLPRQGSLQVGGQEVLPQPQLVLGDVLANRTIADSDVVFSIAWLELMGRLGFLRKNDNWSKLYDRFLDDRDAQGVWHPHKGMTMPRTTNPLLWPMYPLEDHMTGDERWTDVTFRLGFLVRLIRRPID